MPGPVRKPDHLRIRRNKPKVLYRLCRLCRREMRREEVVVRHRDQHFGPFCRRCADKDSTRELIHDQAETEPTASA